MGFHTGGNIPGRPCFLPVAGGRVVCLTGVAPGFDDARLAAWEDGRVRSYKGRESSMRRMLFATAAVAALAWGGGSVAVADTPDDTRSEEHTSELQSLMRLSYAVFCLTKKITSSVSKTDSNQT